MSFVLWGSAFPYSSSPEARRFPADLGVAGVGTGLFAMRSPSRSTCAIAWAGFVMAVFGLWYLVTGWARSLGHRRVD